MRSEFLVLVVILIMSSCTGVPRPYSDNHTFRHGIIPREAPSKREKIHARMLEASLARGKVLYNVNCAGCHGENGKGNGEQAKKQGLNPTDLSQVVREVPNFTFFLSISQWSGQMPGWKEQYSEIDREDLVNYIKTFARF